MISLPSHIDSNNSDSYNIVDTRINSVVQQCGIACSLNCFIFATASSVVNSNDIAQDGYPLQSEGRTPRDEDSRGIEDGRGEVSCWLQ